MPWNFKNDFLMNLPLSIVDASNEGQTTIGGAEMNLKHHVHIS